MNFGLLYPDQGNARLDMEEVCPIGKFSTWGVTNGVTLKGWESPPAGFVCTLYSFYS